MTENYFHAARLVARVRLEGGLELRVRVEGVVRREPEELRVLLGAVGVVLAHAEGRRELFDLVGPPAQEAIGPGA